MLVRIRFNETLVHGKHKSYFNISKQFFILWNKVREVFFMKGEVLKTLFLMQRYIH
jgi:hypothetical protein